MIMKCSLRDSQSNRDHSCTMQKSEPMYEAEQIVDERRAGAGWRYRVKFVGWDDDNWWLSRSELRHTAPELVAAWERDHPK